MPHIPYETVSKWFRERKEKPVTDRIDTMTHDELKAATRMLVSRTDSFMKGYLEADSIRDAIAHFQPTTLDKVRDLLKAEGYHEGGAPYNRIEIISGENRRLHETWNKL